MTAVKKELVFTPEIITSPTQHFTEMVEWSLRKRKLKVSPESQVYLVGVLEKFLNAQSLFEADEPQTLAESYLKAKSCEPSQKINLLRSMADKTLYICGYFGDSLNRKLVDVDYYVDMGGLAYGELSAYTKEENLAGVYSDFAKRFIKYVDVLTHISEYSFVRADHSVLRLYERYLKTGSKLAQEKLAELGVVTIHPKQGKYSKQD